MKAGGENGGEKVYDTERKIGKKKKRVQGLACDESEVKGKNKKLKPHGHLGQLTGEKRRKKGGSNDELRGGEKH